MSYNCGCNNHSGTELPQGPPGNTGATGPQGPRGYRGFQGNTGPQGAQGIGTDADLLALLEAEGSDTRELLDTEYAPALVGGKKPVRIDTLVVNATDYGVIADGNTTTGSGTDNTAALVAAVAAANAAKLPLFLGAGVIRTTAMVDIRGARVIGAGMGRTTIMSTNNVDAVLLVGGGAAYLADVTVKHFSRPFGQTVPNGVGIRIQKLQDRSVIERVHIANVTSGFYCYEPVNDTTNYIFSTTIRDCRIDEFLHSAMYLRGYAAGNTGCLFQNIYAQNGHGDGTYNEAPYGFYFHGFNEGIAQQLNLEWGFYGVGITIGESNMKFSSIHFEQYRAKGISFSSFFNIFGSAAYHTLIEGVSLKDCIFDQANVPDYAFVRVQSGNAEISRVITTGSAVIGTVTRRWVIYDNSGCRVFTKMWRSPDAVFSTADMHNGFTPTHPQRVIARGSLGTGDLYEENGAIKWRGAAGTITTLAVT